MSSAFSDYGQARKERVLVHDETTFDVLAQPIAWDAIIPLQGVAIPHVFTEYTPSIERNPSPGVRQVIPRKKKAQSWTLPMYCKLGTLAGTYPSWYLLMKKAMGTDNSTAHASFTTACANPNSNLVWTARKGGTAGNSITLVYVVSGTNTPLSVSVATNDITVNVGTDGGGLAASTAQQVLDAVIASSAVSALVSVALKAGDTGAGVVAAFTVQSLAGGTGTGSSVYVKYDGATAIEETSFSIWHEIDNLMRGLRGCLTDEFTIEATGTAEPKITFKGFALNEVHAGVTTVDTGGIDDSATTLPLLHADAFQVGPDGTDAIYIKCENEVMLLTAITITTPSTGVGTGTVARGKLGTTAAAHTAGKEVGPWKPGADTKPVDSIIPLKLGSITIGSLSNLRGISFSVTYNNGLQAREDEAFLATGTGYRRNNQRMVTGKVSFYSRQSIQPLLSALEQNLAQVMTVVIGDGTTTPKMTLSMPTMKITSQVLNSGGSEFTWEFSFQALETSAGNDELSIKLEGL